MSPKESDLLGVHQNQLIGQGLTDQTRHANKLAAIDAERIEYPQAAFCLMQGRGSIASFPPMKNNREPTPRATLPVRNLISTIGSPDEN